MVTEELTKELPFLGRLCPDRGGHCRSRVYAVRRQRSAPTLSRALQGGRQLPSSWRQFSFCGGRYRYLGI